jgi:hypothetical protein
MDQLRLENPDFANLTNQEILDLFAAFQQEARGYIFDKITISEIEHVEGQFMHLHSLYNHVRNTLANDDPVFNDPDHPVVVLRDEADPDDYLKIVDMDKVGPLNVLADTVIVSYDVYKDGVKQNATPIVTACSDDEGCT